MSESADRVYNVPLQNMAILQGRIAGLNRRAVRLGCSEITLTVVGTFSTTRRDDFLGINYTTTFNKVTVVGEAPRLEGWTLIAELVFSFSESAETEMVVREVPGQTCPIKYRSSDYHCDHCRTSRRRNSVFVVRHDDGRYLQVGRSCLADFLSCQSVRQIVGAAEYLMDIRDLLQEASDEDWSEGEHFGRGLTLVNTERFVAVTAVIMRKLGWVSRTKASETFATATADHAWQCCASNSTSAREFMRQFDINVEQRDIDLAKAALAWAREISPQEPNSYMYNLGVVCRSEVTDYRNAGTTASVVATYQRQLDREISRQAQANSTHVGQLRQRQTFENLNIVSTKFVNGTWGATTMVKFVDPNGNILVWWASGEPDWAQAGATSTIKATVKKYEEYNGISQTVITRVSKV